jgi:hypothetical protein
MTGRVIAGALAASVVLAGCTSPTCARRVASMRQAFAQMPADAWVRQAPVVDEGFALPVVAAGQHAVAWGPVLHLREVGPPTVMPPLDVGVELVPGLVAAATAGGAMRAYVAIEADAPVAPYQETLRSLASAVDVWMRVRVPAAPSSPTFEQWRAEVKGMMDTPEAGRALAEAMTRAVGTCTALDTGFHSHMEMDERQAALIEAAVAGSRRAGARGSTSRR